jgi:hypothetical protein
MAFGKHWEWRGFGVLSRALRSRVESLPLKFDRPQDVNDEYLWVPGTTINVKVRFTDLKFKRLLGSEQGVERWLEDEAENLPFPLQQPVVAKLATELGVSLPRLLKASYGQKELLELLLRAQPAVQRVVVEKKRWQREWMTPEAQASGGGPVTVELAEIFSPQAITSVALEHPEPGPVVAACDELGLGNEIKMLNYLQALSVWARGGRIVNSER